MHGGATKASRAAAERRLQHENAARAAERYGVRRDIDPALALLEEVHRTAGHVAWLEEQIASGRVEVTAATKDGIAQSVWVDRYDIERNRLIAVTKAALDAGIAERQVQLAEAQGLMLAGVIRSILGDLHLTDGQQESAPAIIRKHLTAASLAEKSADTGADTAPIEAKAQERNA